MTRALGTQNFSLLPNISREMLVVFELVLGFLKKKSGSEMVIRLRKYKLIVSEKRTIN